MRQKRGITFTMLSFLKGVNKQAMDLSRKDDEKLMQNDIPNTDIEKASDSDPDVDAKVDDKSEISRDEFKRAAMEGLSKAAVATDMSHDDNDDTASGSDAVDASSTVEQPENIASDYDDFDDFSYDHDYPELKDTEPDREEPQHITKHTKYTKYSDKASGDEYDKYNKYDSTGEYDDFDFDEKPPRRSFHEFCEDNKRLFKGIGIGCLAILGAAAGIYIYGCATVPKDVIGRNVYIENVDVSGLTYDEALAQVQNTQLLGTQAITLTCSDQTYSINGADVGLSARFEDTVQKAMNYGKSGNRFIDGLKNTIQLFCPHDVVPNANIDETALRNKINEFGVQIYGELVQHSLEIGDGVVVCTPGHTGFDGNTDTAYNEILTAFENEKFSDIAVTLSAGAPQDLTAEDVGNYVYRDAADAYYQLEGGEINIVDEVQGRYVDLEEAAPLAAEVKEGGEAVSIPFYYAEPTVTAAFLQEKLFNDTIGSYSTNYGSSTANRCANIANAAEKINGVILMPGDVFSYNDTVGPRSVENGFYTAKEYSNGQTVDGIGGGVCQVSSTLYNAVLYSDLSIISRTNHMFPVSYCPIGQDATVSDSGIDFKFMNSMDYPIKISAQASGYTITIAIIGTQRDDPRTVKITNETTPVGSDKSVHSVRYVYNSAGELIQTDDLGNSYYMAHSSS